MTQIIICALLLSSVLGVLPPSPTPPPTGITLDGDVLTRFSLPPFGTLCDSVAVRGGPDASIYAPLYFLPAGETVALREQPKRANRDWVMIAPAEWIPLEALCQ